eukprot:scaffold119850_cov69-Phaeocystis_antarctica.AAC.2
MRECIKFPAVLSIHKQGKPAHPNRRDGCDRHNHRPEEGQRQRGGCLGFPRSLQGGQVLVPVPCQSLSTLETELALSRFVGSNEALRAAGGGIGKDGGARGHPAVAGQVRLEGGQAQVGALWGRRWCARWSVNLAGLCTGISVPMSKGWRAGVFV